MRNCIFYYRGLILAIKLGFIFNSFNLCFTFNELILVKKLTNSN